MVRQAQESKQPREEVEGLLLFARHAALEGSVAHCSRGQVPLQSQQQRIPSRTDLQQEGLKNLETATRICKEKSKGKSGNMAGFLEEIDATKQMLVGEFYEEVSSEERRQVAAAMAREFAGTGESSILQVPSSAG